MYGIKLDFMTIVLILVVFSILDFIVFGHPLQSWKGTAMLVALWVTAFFFKDFRYYGELEK